MRTFPAFFECMSYPSAALIEQVDQPFFVAVHVQLTTHIVQQRRELVSLLPGVELINIATPRTPPCHIHFLRCVSAVEAYQDTFLCSRGRGIDKQISAVILSLYYSRPMA